MLARGDGACGRCNQQVTRGPCPTTGRLFHSQCLQSKIAQLHTYTTEDLRDVEKHAQGKGPRTESGALEAWVGDSVAEAAGVCEKCAVLAYDALATFFRGCWPLLVSKFFRVRYRELSRACKISRVGEGRVGADALSDSYRSNG
jgi:hypothetical protein